MSLRCGYFVLARRQAATGKEFYIPIDDPSLKLEGVLALNLHEHSSDVEGITDQALKEARMEDDLARLKGTWGESGRVFWVTESFKVCELVSIRCFHNVCTLVRVLVSQRCVFFQKRAHFTDYKCTSGVSLVVWGLWLRTCMHCVGSCGHDVVVAAV